jgi:hypothetical protein
MGNYRPWEHRFHSKIFADHRPLFIQSVPYMFYLSLLMVAATFILPQTTPKSTSLSPPKEQTPLRDAMTLVHLTIRFETSPRCLLFQLVGYFVLEHLLYAYERESLRSVATLGHA